MKCSFKFIWYNVWVGAFWDRAQRILVICPLPCCVICLEFKTYADAVMALKPVAYWPLGEGSGAIAKDKTGRHDGTYAPSLLSTLQTIRERLYTLQQEYPAARDNLQGYIDLATEVIDAEFDRLTEATNTQQGGSDATK